MNKTRGSKKKDQDAHEHQNVPRIHSTIAAPQTTPKTATHTLPSSASVLGILIDIAAEDGVLVSGATGRVLVTVVTIPGELSTPGELVPGGIVTVVPTRDVELELEVELEVVDVDEEEVLLVVVEAVCVEGTTVVTVDVDTGGGELMVVVNVVVTDPDVLVRVVVRVVVPVVAPVVVPDAVVEVGRVTEEDETDFVGRKSYNQHSKKETLRICTYKQHTLP